MGFHEIRLNPEISYGSRGGPGFATSIIETEAGHEQRVGRWERPRRRYNVAKGIRSVDDIREVTRFFLARKGALNGFRYKDWFDFTSTEEGDGEPAVDDQLIGTGDGVESEFQLVKRYTSGAETIVRLIQKPVAGTVLVEVDSVLQTPTTDYVVDVATGVLTFVTPPSNGLDIRAGFQFDVPVRFAQEADRALQASYDDFDVASIPDIPLVEVLDPRPVPDDWWLGGASAWATTAATNPILISGGRLQLIDVTNAAHALRLPDPTDLPLGGPYFYLVNTGSEIGDIEDEGGSDISTLEVAGSREVLLGPSGWVVI